VAIASGFGTGKHGDRAGFASAIVLAVIAVLIGYEAVSRFLSPVPIHFGEAIPIAVVGVLVTQASASLLSGGHHGRSHDHGHATVMATVMLGTLAKTRCRRFLLRQVCLPFPSSRMACLPCSALRQRRSIRDWIRQR
jgi:hypothetical protein